MDLDILQTVFHPTDVERILRIRTMRLGTLDEMLGCQTDMGNALLN